MKDLESDLTSQSQNSSEIELRSDGPWFEIDTALVLLAGIIVIAASALFFSAHRLGAGPGEPDVYVVGAAGLARETMTCSGIVGCWKNEELIFRFSDDETVSIEDMATGEFMYGTWQLDEQTQTLYLVLAESTLVVTLEFSVDGRMLILADGGDSTFTRGLVLVKESA